MSRAAVWRAWPTWAGQRRSPREGERLTARILRWATGCVAAVSAALLAGAVTLSYVDRHLVPASGWDFSSVLEEVTFIAVPAVGLVLASRRPGNKIGWIILGAGLAAMAPGRIVRGRGVHAGYGGPGGPRLPGMGGPVRRARCRVVPGTAYRDPDLGARRPAGRRRRGNGSVRPVLG